MNDSSNTNSDDKQISSHQNSEFDSLKTVIKYLPLSPHYAKLNAFSSFIGWAVILVMVLLFDLLLDKVNIHFMVLPVIACFSVLSALFGYFSAKACGYFPDEFDIYFKQGLWWRKQTALNYSRIQHIDISHGPLERRYQLATIKFFTAGGAASDLKISGITNQTAENLRTEILKYAKNEETESQMSSEYQAQEPNPSSESSPAGRNHD